MFQSSDYLNLLQQLEGFFNDAANGKVVESFADPDTLKARLSLALPTEGRPLSSLNEDIASYLSHAVRTANPAYFNQLWGGFNAACFMGDMLSSATNTSMYTHEVAPVATLIEKTLIAKIGELVGFTNPEGQFTTGGSNGNLMAMAMARHRAVPTLKQTGLAGMPKLVAFVSEEAHYSFVKAVQLLGLGADQLWKVPVDDDGKLIPTALEDLIALARRQGAQPFFVVGTAGTTVRGAYDPLAQIGAIAQKENLWFHVDGAWGASVLLSNTHKSFMQGVDTADSVVWDAHKAMGMTLICSMLLVKARGTMLSTFSAQEGSDYIFHGSAPDPIDLGPATIHCGRRVDALKLWLAWQHLGDHGWEAMVDGYFSLAAQAEEIIHNHPSLVLIAPRQSLNICFQYRPQGDRALSQERRNELTLKIRQALIEKGLAMVNYAELNGDIFFRLVICNNQTKPEDIELFFEQLVEMGHRFTGQVAQAVTV
ncbi:MAG: pyridoxal-dependent decarboxylase [Cyanobacteria bacterium P01_A01_bin.116]